MTDATRGSQLATLANVTLTEVERQWLGVEVTHDDQPWFVSGLSTPGHVWLCDGRRLARVRVSDLCRTDGEQGSMW